MQEEYRREEFIKDKTEFEKEIDLIRNIIKTREELKNNNKNFEYAEIGLVDYYIYQIKSKSGKIRLSNKIS